MGMEEILIVAWAIGSIFNIAVLTRYVMKHTDVRVDEFMVAVFCVAAIFSWIMVALYWLGRLEWYRYWKDLSYYDEEGTVGESDLQAGS
jgi:uncharacterized membrane protein YciS (DUF1049 family)